MPKVPSGAVSVVPAERRIPELRGKRVLVTGGAGMIDSHLVARLVAEEAALVLVVDELSSGHRELVPRSATVQFLQASITEPKAPELAFRDEPEIVSTWLRSLPTRTSWITGSTTCT